MAGRKRSWGRDPKLWSGLMWPGIWYERRELAELTGKGRDTCGRALDDMVKKGHLSVKKSHNNLLYKRLKSFDLSNEVEQ